MSTDDRDQVPDKDELRRAVDDKVAAAATAAGDEPIVNAGPAGKTAKRAAAKAAKAADQVAAKKSPAKK